MTVALYTNIVSPHQLPLAKELLNLVGDANYRYVFTEQFHLDRQKMGWCDESLPWMINARTQPSLAAQWLNGCYVLICGLRDLDLIESRSNSGKLTLYANERWFKPFNLVKARILLPGSIRMWFPRYKHMAQRFVSLSRKYPQFRILPFGEWAKKDFISIGVPREKMVVWGYFVAPSCMTPRTCVSPKKILWVGRMLDWKRVDTLIKAFRLFWETKHDSCTGKYSRTLIGDGPEKKNLKRLANGLPVEFKDSIPIEDIRSVMRQHDIYVLPSNAQEGWGVALCEALEEGMIAIGSFEAGSSATILPKERLFHAGDWRRLAELIGLAVDGAFAPTGIGIWSALYAAKRFMGLCQ